LIILEVQGWKLEIFYLNSVDSTHRYLKDYLKIHQYKNPIAVITQNQTDGIGSRDNGWCGKKGNLFFSFAISKDILPSDLPIQSASIYFSFILKDILNYLGSKIWLKWPNDFYIKGKKIGGTITSLKGDILLCGIGLNLIEVSTEYGYLDINIDIEKLLNKYFDQILSKPIWKDIFSKYSLEFKKSKNFLTTVNSQKVSLQDASLSEDGSILIANKKVYSLR